MNAIADAHRSARMISPLQAALGAFFGGPIAFACFVRQNERALGDRRFGRTLAMLVLVVVASNVPFAFAILMPDSIVPSLALGALPIVLMVAAHQIAERQIESAGSPAVFRSSWRVAGCTALCFVASVACALVAIVGAIVFLLATSGFR